MAEALEKMGAPAEVIDAWRPSDVRQDDAEGEFEVFEQNREIFQVFMAAETQWRYVGLEGVPAGLDYAGVQASAAALDVAWNRDLLTGLKVMERAAVKALIDARGRSRGTGR